MQLYSDFKEDSSLSFKLIPAVRSPDGPCVDEANCNYEKVTLCAFEQAKDIGTKISFLACMDESPESHDAEGAAKPCASSSSLDWNAISSCYSGSEGTSLLEAASKSFNSKLPGRTTIPHCFVNEYDVSPSYFALKQALCKAGSSAAVCAGVALSIV